MQHCFSTLYRDYWRSENLKWVTWPWLRPFWLILYSNCFRGGEPLMILARCVNFFRIIDNNWFFSRLRPFWKKINYCQLFGKKLTQRASIIKGSAPLQQLEKRINRQLSTEQVCACDTCTTLNRCVHLIPVRHWTGACIWYLYDIEQVRACDTCTTLNRCVHVIQHSFIYYVKKTA